jgi:hypothetical protein
MVIKKTKKVLLGFVTTTSFILLVMVAPTTTTTTALLQQQDDNATTIDEPNIPIGPADEGPDKPIPNNENRTDDGDDDLPIDCLVTAGDSEECPGPGLSVPIDPDDPSNYDKPDTWINWVKAVQSNNGDYVKIRDGDRVATQIFIVDFQSTATDTGKGSHVDFKVDDGDYYAVASPFRFSIYATGEHTIYLKGVDKYGNEDPTPATFTIIIVKKTHPPSDDGNPDTCINSVRTPAGKNIPNGGSTPSKVVSVDFQGTVSGPGSHIDLKLDNGRYKPVASPRTITGLSVGTHTIYLRAVDKDGNVDPTPAKWTFTVKKDKGGGGYPDTWINWVRATPRGVNIATGGSTSSSTVIVDFQGTVAGKGSHIDLKIDDGPYKPVASPRTITGLSDGTHTIYLRAEDKEGKRDPSPAQWKFTVIKDGDEPPPVQPPRPNAISVQTDKSTYTSGDTVKVSGRVKDITRDEAFYDENGPFVQIAFYDTDERRVGFHRASVDLESHRYQNNQFVIPELGTPYSPGTWKVIVIYDKTMAENYFEVLERSPQQQVTISDVRTEPKVLYVNDTFRIVATIANNSTDSITYDISPCNYHLSVSFVNDPDDHVSSLPTGVNCPLIAMQAQLEPGETATLTVPPSTAIYNASRAGDVYTTVSFSYYDVNGNEQNISDSFNFTIHQKYDPQGDEDGDGIPNGWEEKGVDINNDRKVDLDLPSLGADPYHKDIFLEIDYMDLNEPLDKSINDVVSAFRDSPVTNPDGMNGITLHIDVDDSISPNDYSNPDTKIKAKYFGTVEQRTRNDADIILGIKEKIYFYAIFSNSGGASGCQYPDCRDIHIGVVPAPYKQFLQSASLMHELGHGLGLFHGGFEAEKDVDNKSNYLSLMHAAFLYDVPLLDYSGCELPPLDENNLREQEGIGRSCPEGRMTVFFSPFPTIVPTGVPVDWNHDGDFDDTGVIADINRDGKLTILHGHDDWSNLKFGKFITASTASSSEQQQNQTMAAESLEFKKPDHFHDFMKEARESHKMQMDAIEYAIESFTNQSSTNRTTTIDDEEQQVREANMLMEDVHEASSLIESDRLDNATARLEVIKEKVGAWNTDSTESESQRRTIISLIDNMIGSFEKIATPPLG